MDRAAVAAAAVTAAKLFMKLFLIFCLLGITAAGGFLLLNKSHDRGPLVVSVFEHPTSADPMDYDAFIHHISFRAVFASLVSQYKKGDYAPYLAESWESSDDFSVWKFKIRSDLTFENGDRITPEIIAKNFARTAYLMAKAGSTSNIFDSLSGYTAPKNAKSSLPGLSVSENELTFHFKKPVRNLLELASFGLYGLLHPSNYDEITGAYTGGQKPIASGPYSIEEWNENELKLKLRPSYLASQLHPKRYNNILITWNPSIENANLIVGYSSVPHPNLKFYGPLPANILYLHCLSWKVPKSICSSRQNRLALRERFYSALESAGVSVTRSFFPTIIPGIQQRSKSSDGFSVSNSTEKSTFRLRNTAVTAEPKLSNAIKEALKGVSKTVTEGEMISFGDLGKFLSHQQTGLDLTAIVTGILVDDPDNDVRFMFQSKEGIRLPDEDGSINKLIGKSLDLPAINNALYDQAIIWPIAHISMGMWADGSVDMKMINTLVPPTDFSWIGRR